MSLEYTVVSSGIIDPEYACGTDSEFSREIETWLKEGWMLAGGVAVSRREAGLTFHQALYRGYKLTDLLFQSGYSTEEPRNSH